MEMDLKFQLSSVLKQDQQNPHPELDKHPLEFHLEKQNDLLWPFGFSRHH